MQDDIPEENHKKLTVIPGTGKIIETPLAQAESQKDRIGEFTNSERDRPTSLAISEAGDNLMKAKGQDVIFDAYLKNLSQTAQTQNKPTKFEDFQKKPKSIVAKPEV